jgi:hypothetical protein
MANLDDILQQVILFGILDAIWHVGVFLPFVRFEPPRHPYDRPAHTANALPSR